MSMQVEKLDNNMAKLTTRTSLRLAFRDSVKEKVRARLLKKLTALAFSMKTQLISVFVTHMVKSLMLIRKSKLYHVLKLRLHSAKRVRALSMLHQ